MVVTWEDRWQKPGVLLPFLIKARFTRSSMCPSHRAQLRACGMASPVVWRSQGAGGSGRKGACHPGASGCSAWPQTGGLISSSSFSPGSGGQTSKVKAPCCHPRPGTPPAPETLELPAAQASAAVAASLPTLLRPTLVSHLPGSFLSLPLTSTQVIGCRAHPGPGWPQEPYLHL